MVSSQSTADRKEQSTDWNKMSEKTFHPIDRFQLLLHNKKQTEVHTINFFVNARTERGKMSMAMTINAVLHCWTSKARTVVSFKSKLTWFDYSKWWDNMEWRIEVDISFCCCTSHVALCTRHEEIANGIWVNVVKQPTSIVNVNERHRCLQQTIYNEQQQQRRRWWWVQHHNTGLNFYSNWTILLYHQAMYSTRKMLPLNAVNPPCVLRFDLEMG